MDQSVLFTERTKPHKVIIILLIISYLCLLYGVFKQLKYGVPMGSKPMSDTHLIIFTICYGIFIFFFSRIRSELKITKDGFYINIFPLITGDLNKWSMVKEIKVENYSPLKENLGIGFRDINTQMAYLAGGQPGIKLHFRNDDKMLLAARDQAKLLTILTDMQIIKTNTMSNTPTEK